MSQSAGAFDWLGPLPADEAVGTDPELHVSDDFGEQWAHEVDRLVALDIQQAMLRSEAFHAVQPAQPDEHSWSIDFSFQEKPARIRLNWLPGETENRFAFHADFTRTLWQRLFQRKLVTPEMQQQLINAITQLLLNVENVENLSSEPEL